MTYTEKIIDITTGEEIIRPFTKDEIAIVEKAKADADMELAELKVISDQKEKARKMVLDKLGLTADEVAALLA